MKRTEIRDNILEFMDVIFIPGGFFRWNKRESKSYKEMGYDTYANCSKFDRSLFKFYPYFMATCLEAMKFTLYIGLGYEAYQQLIK